MDLDFSNKTVLVTGSSRGVGRAVAFLFAQKGAQVAVHYAADLAAAEETLAALPGGPHHLLQADISHPSAAKRLVEEVLTVAGGLHVLVNNAGIYEEYPIAQLGYAEWLATWERTIGINLLGAANVSFCAIAHMKANGGGKIVNVSSRGAFRGEPNALAYGASKAGLNALSQSLAQALASYGIFVYAVAPGFIETDMTRSVLSGPRGAGIRNQSPLGRVALPEEVARTVVFLASEGTEYLTGCIVDINGASYLRT